MKDAVHSWLHNFKRHMTFTKADESLVYSDKTWHSFFKSAFLHVQKQVQLPSPLSMDKWIFFL
jgi:hypothetical protein